MEKDLEKITDTLTFEERNEKAVALASYILQAQRALRTRRERRKEKMLHAMIQDKKSASFAIGLADSAFRTHNSRRIFNYICSLQKRYGTPTCMSWWHRAIWWLLLPVWKAVPRLFVIFLTRLIGQQTEGLILPGEREALHKKLQKLPGVTYNINRLGEAILGEEEARQRIDDVLEDIADPHISTVSVKISSIFSQINLTAWDSTIDAIKERLTLLLRACKQHNTFLYLDMEEYKDLALTVEAFCQALDVGELIDVHAGIALQSYLPDSILFQEMLTQWAMQRRARGGAPITIRLVKGANLGMERIEASMKGWQQATYSHKQETDAQFKKMLHFALTQKHIDAVHIGVASHNIFDIAYALILKREYGIGDEIHLEMLQGMAPSIQRALLELHIPLTLYCPCAKKEEFHTTIAYLLRRLDENSAEENFLSHLFDIRSTGPVWERQKEQFIAACTNAATVSCIPKRCQNRLFPTPNEPDTDFTIRENRQWADAIYEKWRGAFHEIPLVIAGEEQRTVSAHSIDPSEPTKIICSHATAGQKELEKALTTAVDAALIWKKSAIIDRAQLLNGVAASLRKNRASLIGAMLQESAKIIQEADTEVSEAIDFATYYAQCLLELPREIIFGPQVTLVASPWNFPCSIAASGILAALATGSSVLFKPAPEAVLVGWYVVQSFWEAGVSKELLQFIPTEDEPYGSQLIKDSRITQVILTGATTTAKKFLQFRPMIRLFAETGGKNSIIVSNMADQDLAIRDIVQSAFGYAGQKCSACSLAILHEEVYNDRGFQQRLIDATMSLACGSVWNPKTKVNPLIRPARQPLLDALTTTHDQESWLVRPAQDIDNPHLWSPGIKWNVKPGGETHTTEFFGPLLAVIPAKDLSQAIHIANSTPYGLTAGLHSLDTGEQQYWQRKIEAGNLYINRTITGAIVNRQPFGGTKASSFGIGMKAGGPHYLVQFCTSTSSSGLYRTDLPASLHILQEYVATCALSSADKRLWNEATLSYSYWWTHYFSQPQNRPVVGEENVLTFEPRTIVFLLDTSDALLDILLVFAAAAICGAQLIVAGSQSINDLRPIITYFRWQLITHEASPIETVPSPHIRMLHPPDAALAFRLAPHISCLDTLPPHHHGRVELIRYLREVTLSYDFHRYGNLYTRH